MNLIIFAALIAACGAAKLDRTYLPPASAATAGGSSGSLQTPFSRSNQNTQRVEDIPPGGFVNQHQGVVVDAASTDTRATNPISGLGGPRISYGSTASKVGEAAFRVTATNQYQYNPGSLNFGVVPGEPDLSAFHQPISSSRPGNYQIVRDYVSNTVKYQNDIDNDKYNYAFETDNGIKASENGVSTDGVEAQGGYSYTGDDGKVYSVVYTAGENGYQPSGNHLPTPPPIPVEILKSLEQNAKEEAAGVVDDGSYDAQKYNTEDDYTKNDANGKYNDEQSNKFGDRPGFGSHGFINQNQQAFVSSNFNGQFSSNNNVKVTTFSKPGPSQFGQNKNSFNNKNEYLPPKGTSFGKPFVRPSSYDTSNPGLVPSSSVTSKPTFSIGSSFGNGYSNSPFTTGSSFGNGNLNSPFNTGSTFGNGNSNSAFNAGDSFGNENLNSPFNTGSSFGNGNSNSPFNTGGSFGNGILSSPFNTGSSFGNGNSNSRFPTGSSLGNENSNSASPGQTFEQRPIQQSLGGDSSLNQGSFANQLINSNDNSASNFGIPAGNVQTNPNIHTDFSGSKPSGIFNPSLETNLNSTLQPASATKQPQLTLTTPLESFGDSNSDKQPTESDTTKSDNTKEPTLSFIGNESGQTDSDIFPIQSTSATSGDISKGGSTIESFPQKSQDFGSQATQSQENLLQIFSSNHPKDVNFASTTQIPSFGPTSQFGQSQGPDDSYLYNRPSKPFYTPSSSLGSNENNKPSSQFDKDTPSITSQTSLFTNPLQGTFSFNSQGSTKYPNPPTLAQIVPGTSTSQDIDQKQNVYQQNIGITQASISPFPSLTPTVSSDFKEPSQFGLKPNQQILSFNSPSVSGFSQTSPTSAITTAQISQEKTETESQKGAPNQQYTGEVYEYNIPTQGLSSQNQEPLNITEKEPTSQLGDLNIEINKENLSITSGKQDSTLTSQPQQTSNLFNQGSSTFTSSQKPTQTTQFGLESSTQFTQDSTVQNQGSGFSLTSTSPQFVQGISNNQEYSTFPHFSTANKQTSTQSGFDRVKPISSQSQNQSELSNTGSQLVKQDTQSSSELGLGTLGEKESDVAKLQQPIQQSTPQFGYKPSTFFPSSLQTQSHSFSSPTPVTSFGQQSILTSSKKPSTQLLPIGAPSGSVFGQGNFYNKGTIVPHSFQQSGTHFGYKPTTVFPSSFQTQTSIFNTPSSATQQQNIFTSSKKPFGPQSTFQFGQGSFGNKGTTASVFQQSGNQFGYRPSAIGTNPFQPQFGQQSISTSPKTPSSQQIIFGSRPTSQFGTGNLNNKETTVSQFQQPNQKTDTQFNYKPSTSIPGSAFTQSSIFNSKHPTNQFEQSSFPAKLQTPPTSQPGLLSTTTIGQANVNNKESSDFQYQNPNQQFGTQFNYKPTTSIIGTQTSSFTTSKTPNTQSSQFNTQSSSPFGQSTFGNKGAIVAQFQLSQLPSSSSSSSQPQGSTFSSSSAISQFGQTSDSTVAQKPIDTSIGSGNEKEKTTSQQTVNAFNKPSTFFASTSQGTQFGEIYDYQKPAQNFITPSENDHTNTQSQFSAQSNTQQGLGNTQTESEQSEHSTINARPDAQLNQASINDKDTSFYPSSQQKPESGTPLNNKSSSSQAQSSISLDQTTTTREIYEYNKPDQELPSSEKEETQFGQKLQGSQIEKQTSGNGDNFNTNQEISPQITQSTLTGSFSSQKLDSSTTEAPSSTNGNTSGTRPQFAFHSACCGGSIINRKPVSQNNLKPIDSFEQSKNPQKGSQIFAGVGEQFGGPRKPPNFDETGYHY